jgi:2-dehydropantoate 2-reductase
MAVVVMRHAFLGAGGIGGLLAGALARSGDEVVMLLRPSTLLSFDGRLRVESVVLGDFEVEVDAVSSLDRPVDALWVTTKATQLTAAWSLAPPGRVGESPVIPLLNGVDHLALLRTRYANVFAAAIRVESERVSPSLVRQSSPFLRVDVAGAHPIQEALRASGIECHDSDDEQSLLWGKLVALAPIALATTAIAVPFGAARTDDRFVGCREEALTVARAEGARVDATATRAFHEQVPADMRSSMQKDVAAGRQPELDAIAGPIIRGGAQHGIPTLNTASLAAEIHAHTSH